MFLLEHFCYHKVFIPSNDKINKTDSLLKCFMKYNYSSLLFLAINVDFEIYISIRTALFREFGNLFTFNKQTKIKLFLIFSINISNNFLRKLG